MKPKSIFVIGECMIELQRTATGMSTRFGGDTLNASVYLARLINPAVFQVAYVTALGVDSLSDDMVADWQQEGLDTQWVQRLPDKLPGMYLIETNDVGERRFHYWRNDSAARFWMHGPRAEQVKKALGAAPIVVLSGISLAILSPEDRDELLLLMVENQKQGGILVFDNNYRPRLWQSREVAVAMYARVLALTDIALLTLDDEELLYGSAEVGQVISRTSEFGVGEIVIKRGAQSCLIHVGSQTLDVPAQQVSQVVDTTAAGDSFGAAYVAARLSGKLPVEAAQAGHRLAATVIGHRGAIIPRSAMPD